MLKYLKSEKGAAHLLLIVVALGLLGFIIISNTFSFRDKIFQALFPKPPSKAQEIVDIKKIAQDAKDKQDKFLTLNKDYQQASAVKKLGTLVDFKKAAEDRKKAMLELMENDPKEFLKYAMPKTIKSTLPQQIQQDIEEETSLEGTFKSGGSILFNDQDESFIAERHYYLEVDKGTPYEMFFDKEPSVLKPEEKIKIAGYKLERSILVNSIKNPESSTVLGLTTDPNPSFPAKIPFAVILITHEDNVKPWTNTYVQGVTFTNSNSVRAAFLENSYGAVSVEGAKNGAQGDVYGYFKIKYTDDEDAYPVGCGIINGLLTYARYAATSNGVNLGLYDRLIYAEYHRCLAPGWGAINWYGQEILLLGSGNSHFTTRQVAHILARTYKDFASWGYFCKDANGNQVPISQNCSIYQDASQRYTWADPLDIMGWNNTRQMSATSRARWGFLFPTTINSPGTYTIGPIEASNSAYPRSIRIPRDQITTSYGSCYSTYYYLDFRQPIGVFDNFSPTDPAVNGVSIRLGGDYVVSWAGPFPYTAQCYPNQQNSSLIDTNAGINTTNPFPDAPLQVGKTFEDPYGSLHGIRIITKSVSPSGATVDISFFASGQCYRQNPLIEMLPSSQYGMPGDTKSYGVKITDKDSITCSDNTITATTTLPDANWLQTPSQIVQTLKPGESKTQTIDITSPKIATPAGYNIPVTGVGGQYR